MRQLHEQLAQDLEGIAGALRAGASLLQAIQAAANDGSGPLTEEWNRFCKDIGVGASLDEALVRLQQRLPIPAIRSFATAVSIVRTTGGNLAGVLLILAESLREEIAFQGKLRVMTTQGKMSGYVVSAMPFLLFTTLSFLAPDLMRPLFTTPVGLLLLGLVLVMVTVGSLMIKRIVTIEV
jgi:tight adherence protein B